MSVGRLITVKNRLITMEMIDQIIKSGNISHAYLFCGPKGSDRTEAALYFVKSLLCGQGISGGCDSCSECTRINHGNHPSFITIQPDGTTIKIAQVKELQRRFAYKSVDGNYQIYLIEDADTLSLEAANSLLKFLEEPIGSTVGILLAEQPEQLVSTIVSRCQIIRFRSINANNVFDAIVKQGVNEQQAGFLSKIWHDSDKIVELVTSEKFATIQKIVVQLNEDFLKSNHTYLLLLDREWFNKKPSGEDTEYLLDYLLYWFRELLVRELQLVDRYLFPEQEVMKYQHSFSVDNLQIWIADIIKMKQKLRYNLNAQLAIEALLLRMQEELMCVG